MTTRAIPKGPNDLHITIDRFDRYWVAEALIDFAIGIEREAIAKRKGSPGRQRENERALRLRELADRIRP